MSIELGRTIIFTALVLLLIAIIYVLRKPFAAFSNRSLTLSVAGSIFHQESVLYIPFLHKPFQVEPLGAFYWIPLVAICFIALVITDIALSITRKKT